MNPFRDDLPAPPIELVLQLIERETAPPSVNRGRRRAPSVGRIFVAASVLVPVAVAIFALSDLRRNAHRPSAVKPTAGLYAPVVQRVVAEYAIFRRPQTAADRAIPIVTCPNTPSPHWSAT